MGKKSKKKNKHIVGTKEFIFDIVSIVLLVIIGIYFGYRSIKYYSKETEKKKVEANTLVAAIINNNKITTDDNGLHKSRDGYYFSGYVENNYLKAFNRMYRIIDVNQNNEVKIISDIADSTFIYGNSNSYKTSNVNNWLNNPDGNFYQSIPGVDKLLTKFNYCEGVLNKNKVTCKSKNNSTYFSILEVDDYIRALGKRSYLNNSTYNFLLGYDKDNYPLIVNQDGTVNGINNDEGYGVRSVMKLKKNALITGGLGTKEDPYVLNQEGLDNNINKYVRLGNDLYSIIEENNDFIKLKATGYLKVNNIDTLQSFSTKSSLFNPLYRNNIGYYLNRTYLNTLPYKNSLSTCSFYTGLLSADDNNKYNYLSIYKDKVDSKIGLLNMFDLNYNNELDDYYLINSASSTGSMAYVYNKDGVIEDDMVSEKKKIVPVTCLMKSLIKSGDGTINNPYVVE